VTKRIRRRELLVKTPAHMAVGAVAAALPDVVLFAFAWRRDWLPEGHPLVRAHRFLHTPRGIIVPFAIAWASHLVTDKYSEHRQAP
jgi:hypothetical protein